jgi:NADP-dependent alcohol dehydrogenase
MNNFIYQNPVKIVFGKGQIESLPALIPAGAKIMLTYGGGSIKKNGVYDRTIKALNDFDAIEFGGIEPNPSYETLMRAVQLAKSEKVNFLLAVGGGSVIDGTKFIAAAMKVEVDPWEILLGKIPVTEAVPIGTILTLPATGSEMNAGAVISKQATHEKYAFGSPLVMPQFSILEPEVCFSLPTRQIANGIVDSFVHVMEQYLTYPANAMVQDYYSESLLKTLIEVAPKVLAHPLNYDYCANYMWAATMALNGLIAVGVPQDWTTHMIGHELTALHGVDHAQTLAIVLPGVMDVKRDEKRDKLEQYAYRVWNIASGTSDERINEAINRTVAFFESTGIKTKLPDYRIGTETIDTIVQRFILRGTVLGEKRTTTPDQVRLILENRL